MTYFSFFGKLSIKRFSFLFFFLISHISYSQGDWLEYLTTRQKKLMSVQVDMEFDYNKPNYKNLLIVGSNYNGCLKNGFPNENGLKELFTFSDTTEFTLNKLTKNKLVGVVTFGCVGLDIYYVKDTINLRKSLERIYSDKFPNLKSYVFIKSDKKRQYYYNNLFPPILTDDFFLDQEYLIELAKEGDKLDDKRLVTHWAYFKNLKKRQKFEKNVKALDYQIDTVFVSKEDKYPYHIQFSKENLVDPQSIYKGINTIKVLVYSSNSIYGGWGFDPETDE